MPASSYLDYSGRDDVLGGGARKIPVETPKGTFSVWTKRVGNDPGLRVLLLHGGPGATHEYLEACDSFLPNAGIEYYYYDQLGSGFSDQPEEPSLWDVDRFVSEVEQVRQALGMDASNFVLYGQSWGGILAMEYALAHQQNLRGLIISNMMASVPAYNTYAEQVLMPPMDQAKLAEIKAFEAASDTENPRYMELLLEQHYVKHVLRIPPDEWPDAVQRGRPWVRMRPWRLSSISSWRSAGGWLPSVVEISPARVTVIGASRSRIDFGASPRLLSRFVSTPGGGGGTCNPRILFSSHFPRRTGDVRSG